MSVVIDGTSGITFPDSSSQSAAAASGYPAKAWVYFNGQSTVTINGSGNVSSLTDNGTGDYTVNFSTALTASNFSLAGVASVWAGASVSDYSAGTARATGSVRIYVGRYNTVFDADHTSVMALL